MTHLFFVAVLAALGFTSALQVPVRQNAVPWFEIQPAKQLADIPANETKPLIGQADGHEPTDSDLQHMSAWKEFKQEFGRVYETFEEELQRFKIFVKNLVFVYEHNKLYQAGKSSFEVGINEYADMTNAEFVASRNKLRFSMTQAKKMALTYEPSVDVADLPDSVDWRTKGYVTPIKNQGHCGSCWSFSATGALEGQWFAKSGKLVSLSEQQLVDCSQKFGDEGCNGGLMDNAFSYVKAVGGIETEAAYPYTAEDGKCKFNKSAIVAQDTGFVDVKQGDESALQQAIATVGPVSVAIDASHMSFQMYKKGVYDEASCSSTELDHGVLAVGYGTDSASGKAFWIVKNSWGTGWGEQGYIRMVRNASNRCGIATAASYPTV